MHILRSLIDTDGLSIFNDRMIYCRRHDHLIIIENPLDFMATDPSFSAFKFSRIFLLAGTREGKKYTCTVGLKRAVARTCVRTNVAYYTLRT